MQNKCDRSSTISAWTRLILIDELQWPFIDDGLRQHLIRPFTQLDL
tara:strand:+ start:294 stop:431 length:138 start_codon:yes stop_codon:yes gene_type:complete